MNHQLWRQFGISLLLLIQLLSAIIPAQASLVRAPLERDHAPIASPEISCLCKRCSSIAACCCRPSASPRHTAAMLAACDSPEEVRATQAISHLILPSAAVVNLLVCETTEPLTYTSDRIPRSENIEPFTPPPTLL